MPECLSSQARVNVILMPNEQASRLMCCAASVHLSCIFMSLTSLSWAVAGSGGLLRCWCKMRAASIDCVCLSVACHSTSLCGVVWTNDNSTATTTWAQSTWHILLSLSLSPSPSLTCCCLSNWLTPVFQSPICFSLPESVFYPPPPPPHATCLHSWIAGVLLPFVLDWVVDTDKMR